MFETAHLLWLVERPWTVIREGITNSHGVLPVIVTSSFVLVIITRIVSCDIKNNKLCNNYRHLLTIVRSESMKPALERGDILISLPLQQVDEHSTTTNKHQELVSEGDIILLEVCFVTPNYLTTSIS